MTGHLGHEHHDPIDRGSGNSRNGHSTKRVSTDVGDESPRVWWRLWPALGFVRCGGESACRRDSVR